MVSSPFGGVDFFDRALWEEVCEALELDFAGRRVLDVGCGRALCEAALKEKGADYIGVDVLCSFQPRANGPEQFCLGQGQQLPFRDDSFDGFLCLDALEHFSDPAAAAQEFERVLRPNGFVFLSIPNYFNVAGLVKWFQETWGPYERNTWAPFGNWTPQAQERLVTPGKVKRWFAGAGFTRRRCIGLDREVVSGLFPWQELSGFPEVIRFRLQRHGTVLKRLLARAIPATSLHLFWKFER